MDASDALKLVEKLYKRLGHRAVLVQQADEYYRGRHPLAFASQKWREYHADRYKHFSDNWCAPVANSPAERLRIDGFRLSDAPKPDGPEKQLWNDWLANDMEAQSSQGLLASGIGGRSFTLVWGDAESEPVSTWERPDQVIVDYDPERPGVYTSALKCWCDEDTEYATLYLPDEVWKWQRPYVPVTRDVGPVAGRGAGFFTEHDNGLILPSVNAAGWKERRPPGDDTWPLDNPLGEVPVVEWPNRPMLGGEPLSEISGTIAMQDTINLLWAYLLNAADHVSMPARVVMGQDAPTMPVLDENGQKIGERPIDLKKLAEDRILYLRGQNTKIGQWDAAHLDPLTSTIETAVTHIAAQTRTPPHYLVLGKGMVNVNADGMRAAETGLVMKVGEAQLFYTPAARRHFRLNALVRGDQATAAACRTGTVKWKDAENRSTAQLVDAMLKLYTMRFPFQYLAEMYESDEVQLERLLEMRQKELEADPVGALSRQLGQQQGMPNLTMVENQQPDGG